MNTPDPDTERCKTTELLVKECACDKHRRKPEVNPYDGLLIDRFIYAKYDGVCALFPEDEEHRTEAGDHIGLAVQDSDDGRPPFERVGWVCPGCTEKIAAPR